MILLKAPLPALRRIAAHATRAGAIASAISIAACGGGGDGPNDATADSASTTTGIQSIRSTTSGGAADTSTVSADSTVWTTISHEYEAFTVSGTQTVRYGIGSAWITRQVTDSGFCSNGAFGNDPAVGIVKVCQLASTSSTPSPPAGTWTFVADENATYSVAGTQTVRYGAGTTWVTMQVTGGGTCSNGAFGNDPLVGVFKQCQVASGAAATWTRVASENEAFTVSGSQSVRYGSGTTFITMSVTASGNCSNAFFGNDPLVGVVKECQVSSSGSVPPPVATAGICTPPIGASDTSATAATVGNGTPASCTEGALRAAVNASGVVRFNCGAAPATISIASTIAVPTTRDTVIDGENRVTLDGGGNTRILSLEQGNYRTNTHGLTLQHIALRNGKAPGGGYVPPSASNTSCAYGYADGSGAAILVRDARFHAIDVDFQNNAAATPGPDVGGGAVYALGSLDVLISGSRFSGNSGANAGAVGMLQSNLRVYNSSFSGNSASGTGQNKATSASAGCPGVGHPGQGGAGGNGGAIAIDGSDDTDVMVCGSTFTGNRANELAGAMFRTANYQSRRTTIDRSLFQNNTAGQGGAMFLSNSVPLDILASTFAGNSAKAVGAAHLQSSKLNIVNSTFSGNVATQGVGGALFMTGSLASSSIMNSTFAGNKSTGGPGYFSAALFGDNNFPITNTVFANNTTADPWNPMQCGFTPAFGANDLQWPFARVAGGATDTACVSGIAFADPLLGSLADNTGPTQTRAPAANSPLRNAGRNCPSTDQRGKPRNTSSCTIGAVE